MEYLWTCECDENNEVVDTIENFEAGIELQCTNCAIRSRIRFEKDPNDNLNT